VVATFNCSSQFGARNPTTSDLLFWATCGLHANALAARARPDTRVALVRTGCLSSQRWHPSPGRD
jgi:hypothetical protein